MPTYNTHADETIKNYQTIDPASSTVSDWVDAFNNNASAGQQFITYLKETLANSVLYDTQLPATIGGVTIRSLTNLALNFVNISPDNLTLDNFYLYFRNINQILLLDQKTFDLTDYADNKLHLFYVNSDLGFRVADTFDQEDDEVCLFRFAINTELKFTQVYTTFQRFGTSVYDSAGEYFQVNGCSPKALDNISMHVDLENGFIKRSGIKFDDHVSPDLYKVNTEVELYPLRYITENNTVDFSAVSDNNIISDKVLNYSTHSLTNVPANKFTIQRILLDVYSQNLILQYGNTVYDSMEEALTSIYNVSYDYPYNTKIRPMFIPLGILFIKSGCTDLTDSTQAMFVEQTTQTITEQQSTLFAEDAYARSRLAILNETLDELKQEVEQLTITVNNHIDNHNNPHQVTKTQIGLSEVDNYSYNTIKSKIQQDLANNWIKKNVDDTTSGKLTIGGGVEIPSNAILDNKAQYIKVNNHRLYVGVNPGSISGAQAGDYAIYFE